MAANIDMDDWRKFWRGEATPRRVDAAHADYPPHEPGYLYDCPACEARCHCTAGSAECVYAGYHAEFCRTCGEPSDNGEGWDGECGNCADRTYRRQAPRGFAGAEGLDQP